MPVEPAAEPAVDSLALADLASAAARAAAGLIVRRRADGVEVAATKTTSTDVVTAVDRESEELIRALIAAERPEDGFLGEEGEDVPSRSGVRWIIDPIDGTVNFLYGIPQYAVSIAAEVDGEVVAGVVHDVPKDVHYRAVKDASGTVASTRDGQPIAVKATEPLGHMLVGTGFSYDSGVRAVQGRGVARLLPRVRDLRRAGSCALDLCAVAEGSLDGYFEEGPHPWDYAAGGLIAEGAGARFLVTAGAAGGDFLLCAPEGGFDALREAVSEAGLLAP